MARAITACFGLALLVLWISGISAQATPWVIWLDLAAAAASFGVAAAVRDDARLRVAVGLPGLVGAGVLVVGIVGLASGANRWVTWWSFALGAAYLLFAFVRFVQGVVPQALEDSGVFPLEPPALGTTGGAPPEVEAAAAALIEAERKAEPAAPAEEPLVEPPGAAIATFVAPQPGMPGFVKAERRLILKSTWAAVGVTLAAGAGALLTLMALRRTPLHRLRSLVRRLTPA